MIILHTYMINYLYIWSLLCIRDDMILKDANEDTQTKHVCWSDSQAVMNTCNTWVRILP